MTFAWARSADALFDGLCLCHDLEEKGSKRVPE
jgi:hypothetical protein